jgi:hypothetical protein
MSVDDLILKLDPAPPKTKVSFAKIRASSSNLIELSDSACAEGSEGNFNTVLRVSPKHWRTGQTGILIISKLVV